MMPNIKPDVLSSFKMQNSLNPKIWKGETLKPEIRKKLLVIAKKFFDDMELPESVKLRDIVLTGSIANFNWSKFSDIDLHLRVKFSEVGKDEKFVADYFQSKKNVWNEQHDIEMFGFPVEVYVENVGETHVASGLYSIANDKWIVEPHKKKMVVDPDDIKTKAMGFVRTMPMLNKLMEGKKYDKVIAAAEKIMEKIRNMRKSGLTSGGEFSVENLAFKVLRRTSFLEKVTNLKKDAYDKKMTMESKNGF